MNNTDIVSIKVGDVEFKLGDIFYDYFGASPHSKFVPSKVEVIGIAAEIRRGIRIIVDKEGATHLRQPKCRTRKLWTQRLCRHTH